MHFSYRYALPLHGLGSYAVTSANGEYSAYTDMTDYKGGSWTRPANNALGEVQDESGNTVKVLKVTKVTTGSIIRNFICSK